jgi:hypothetical protein
MNRSVSPRCPGSQVRNSRRARSRVVPIAAPSARTGLDVSKGRNCSGNVVSETILALNAQSGQSWNKFYGLNHFNPFRIVKAHQQLHLLVSAKGTRTARTRGLAPIAARQEQSMFLSGNERKNRGEYRMKTALLIFIVIASSGLSGCTTYTGKGKPGFNFETTAGRGFGYENDLSIQDPRGAFENWRCGGDVDRIPPRLPVSANFPPGRPPSVIPFIPNSLNHP